VDGAGKTCPHLEYRDSDEDVEFDHDRPYCGAMGAFVSPMRADRCNDRFDFHHAADCQVYEEATACEEVAHPAGDPEVVEADGPTTD